MTNRAPGQEAFNGGEAAGLYRTAEDLPALYRRIATAFVWAENTCSDEFNTDEALGKLGTYAQMRMECLDGTPIMVRDSTDWSVEARPGRLYPVRYHIDVPLDSQSPEQITRITLHGPHDDIPDVFSVQRLVQKNDGVTQSEQTQLSNEEQDEAFISMRAYFETCMQLGGVAFIESWLQNLKQSPEPQEIIEDNFEAREAQAIVDNLLSMEGLSASDIPPEKPLHFSVWDWDNFENNTPLVVRELVVKRLSDDSNSTITEIFFNRLDDLLDAELFVMIANLEDIFTTEVSFYTAGPTAETVATDGAIEEYEWQPTALPPETRRRIYAAMKQQLILSGNAVRYTPDPATDQ